MKKARETYNTIDEFHARFSDEIQLVLSKMRDTIKKAAPDAQEAIAYGIPTFRQFGNLVHYSAYSGHIGFYPGASGIAHFKKELSKYQTSKGTVQFPLDQNIPYSLITKIVKFRVKENQAKAASKRK